jgi:hypothetical protein
MAVGGKNMKMRKASIVVTISIVALVSAATGFASATFTHESMVSGTGLVMVDNEMNTAPGNFSENLKITLHVHGCGEYDSGQLAKQEIVKKYGKLVSETITLEEDVTMTHKPMTLKSGSLILINEETAPMWKEDLCIMNYQIGTAMRELYTTVDYIRKNTKSNVTCLEPKCVDEKGDPKIKEKCVHGVGVVELDILSTVSGASHVGVLIEGSKKGAETIRVSEDYLGNFTIQKMLKTKEDKKKECKKDTKQWLECPSGDP